MPRLTSIFHRHTVAGLLMVLVALSLELTHPLGASAQQATSGSPFLSSQRLNAGELPAQEDGYAQRVPHTCYVQFREGYLPSILKHGHDARGAASDAVMRIFNKIGVTSIEPFDRMAYQDAISHKLGIDRIYTILYTADEAPLDVVIKLLATGHVETASPRYIFQVQTTEDVPNDPDYGQEWYLQNIKMEAAWEFTHGDSNVVIADVDEGVNYNHEDLMGNIKYNTAEFVGGKPDPNNKQDKDGNGFVNDYRGWDAAGQTTGGIPQPTNDPYPSMTPGGIAGESSHGTNTTGCYGAVGNNKIGMAGVAYGCRILPVKIGNANGQLIAGYEGVHYAAVAKAKVINCSWGGRADPAALPFAQIFPNEVTARGEVMVAAAGNYHMNNDVTPFVPACIPGVLSVGASDENDKPTSFTHWGHVVSVFAPGINIYTTDIGANATINNAYTPSGALIAGTSFSSPITAGLVGLVMSKYPKFSPDAVKQRVIQTCDPMNASSPYLYHGRINALSALNAPGHPSIAVQLFTVSSGKGDSLDVIGKPSNLNVVFQNGGLPGTSVNAELQPGPGYTWSQFDPNYHTNWPSALIGTIDSGASYTGHFNSVMRSGQFSEGFAPLTFYIYDGSGYNDTLHIQVPLTKQPGMSHRLFIQHARAVKQVDALHAWAGFGYYLNYHDPEKRKDTFVLISQFSQRQPDGTWSDPTDIGGGDIPVTCMDALDASNAWFGGLTTNGTGVVQFTNDGGASWMIGTVGGPVRAVHMTSNTNGTVLSESGGKWAVYTTSDGGQNWQAGQTASVAGEVAFDNGACFHEQNGWFGTSRGAVAFTTDGGTSWKNIAIASATAKQKQIMAVGFADDDNTGYAAARSVTGSPDSAQIFFSQSKGLSWQAYDPNHKMSPQGLVAYSITFLPGTTTAVITTNKGVFELKSPTDTMRYLGAPSSWDPTQSVLSAAGSATKYTICAVSENGGVADYSVGVSGVTERSVPSTELSITSAPNPMSLASTVYFTLPTAQHVSIHIADVLGRTVATVFEGELAEGPHAIPVSGADLAAGVYHVSLETADGNRSDSKIVVVR